MLVLNINRKPYMGTPLTPSHLTLNGVERSKACHLHFEYPVVVSNQKRKDEVVNGQKLHQCNITRSNITE